MELPLEKQIQTEWGWKIAAYLFLAGVGAGSYAIGAIADFAGKEGMVVSKIGISLGFPLLLIGTFFLIADLGVRYRALKVFLNPGTSWIARGSIIISAFMILGFIHLTGWVWPFDFLGNTSELRKIIGIINFVFAILTMIYTGVLLGASKSIAIWSSGILPLLFLVSGLSTGVLSIILILSGFGFVQEAAFIRQLNILTRGDILLIIIECIVLAFYLQSAHRTDESRASAHLILTGRLAFRFWTGVVISGLFIPLAVESIEILGAGKWSVLCAPWILSISALSGLFGGLMLRHIVLEAGVKAPLRASGIQYTFPKPLTG